MNTHELENLCSLKGYERLSSIKYMKPFCKCKSIYKYMDMETALVCLSKKTIRFVEPTEWPDKFEGRFYKADFSKVCKDQSMTPKLYACCFTLSKTSEAAWKTYSYDKTGLGCRCVQFKLNLKKFREIIDSYAKRNDCIVYESKMNYKLSEEQISSLHHKSSVIHDDFFHDFCISSYFNLLSIKRNAFYYENELRYFLVPQKTDVNQKVDVSIEWSNVIEEIMIDKKTTAIEEQILRLYCEKYGIKIVQDNKKGTHLKRFNLYNMSNHKIKIE